MKYIISENKKDLKPVEFIELSKLVGFGKNRVYDIKLVKKAITNTFYVITIKDKNKLIACARVLSDNLLLTTIPDIFVHPDYQRKLLGKLMINIIKDKFSHTKIYFRSRPGNELFFEKLGFKKGLQSYELDKKI